MLRTVLIRLCAPVAVALAWQAPEGGYVLGPGEGEVLRRPNGTVVIKADPKTGSRRMALGTQDLNAGAGIGVHRHEQADEILWIQNGRATAILGDRKVAVGPGSMAFVPRGVWHGVESAGEPVSVLWIVSPPGLEAFFREVGAPPGTAVKQLTPAQMAEIAARHGTTFKRN